MATNPISSLPSFSPIPRVCRDPVNFRGGATSQNFSISGLKLAFFDHRQTITDLTSADHLEVHVIHRGISSNSGQLEEGRSHRILQVMRAPPLRLTRLMV